MKASEILRNALNTHYINSHYGVGRQSEYMCHAVQGYLQDMTGYDVFSHELSELANPVIATFMPAIIEQDTSCLMVALNRTNKKYLSLCRRAKLGHNTPGCYKIRVQYWLDHIANLEAKGL